MSSQFSAPAPLATGAAAESMESSEFGLGDLVGTVLSGLHLFAAVLASVLFIGIFYSWASLRVFTADALVQVELDEQKSITDALGDVAQLLGSTSSVGAEVELLRSRLMIGSVVDEMNLTVQARPRYLPMLGEPISRFYSAMPADVATADRNSLRFAWGKENIQVTSFDVPDSFLGQEFIITRTSNGVELSLDGDKILEGAVGQRLQGQLSGQPISIFVQDLNARVGTDFVLIRSTRKDRIQSLAEKLRVAEKTQDSGMLAVTFEAFDPALARDFVNKLVTAYQRQNVERRSAEAEQTLAFLRVQLPKLREQVESSEASLNDYRLKQGSADLDKETDLVLQESVALETKRRELESSREESLQRFTPVHPTVQAIDRQLQQVKAEMDGVASRVKNLPETQQELLRLNRDVQVNSTLYLSLLNSFQELQVVKAGTVGNVRVVDYALLPTVPSQPRVPLILVISLVIGVFLGLIAVFVRQALHSGVEDPMQVERALGIATYCAVPFSDVQIRIAHLLKKKNKGAQERLLAVADSTSPAVEALRGLRTSLHFGQIDARNNILMMTGPSPGLGKSFVSANLGAVLATSGKRVAIIDCDLRRGYLHEYFGYDRTPGFSDYIAGTATLEQVIRPTHVDGLSLVSTGALPPNPAELLLSAKVADMMSKLSQMFDTVIIDTPPVLAVTDAVVIGRHAGTTLLVLKAGEHSLRMIEDSIRRLHVAGVAVRGTIFNQVGRGSKGGRYGYKYGYSYGYYHYDYGAGTAK